MRNKKKRFQQVALLVGLILLAAIVVPLVRAAVECRYFGGGPTIEGIEREEVGSSLTAELPDYARSEDQTYLTLPEWYIVFNADEYAAFLKDNRPSQFPYFQAIGQYWQSYYRVCALTRDDYPFNSEYQMTLAVIGASFTVENIIRGGYEKTVGRVAEWFGSETPTEEEIYGQQVAAAYGDFVHTTPWFEFPFGEKLRGLWSETSLWGAAPLRKWERKFALSVEYGGKALYGWLLRQGAEATFAPIKLETQVWATGLTEEILADQPDVRLVEPIDETTAIAAVPRYEAFTQIVPPLTVAGVAFVEIAGNDEIMITIIAPALWTYDLSAGEVLLELPIPSQPSLKRIAVRVPVPALHTVLADLEESDIRLEHIYDY